MFVMMDGISFCKILITYPYRQLVAFDVLAVFLGHCLLKQIQVCNNVADSINRLQTIPFLYKLYQDFFVCKSQHLKQIPKKVSRIQLNIYLF